MPGGAAEATAREPEATGHLWRAVLESSRQPTADAEDDISRARHKIAELVNVKEDLSRARHRITELEKNEAHVKEPEFK